MCGHDSEGGAYESIADNFGGPFEVVLQWYAEVQHVSSYNPFECARGKTACMRATALLWKGVPSSLGYLELRRRTCASFTAVMLPRDCDSRKLE